MMNHKHDRFGNPPNDSLSSDTALEHFRNIDAEGNIAMGRRSGSADLPLHGGAVPKWLADRMTRLGAVMAEAIIHTYGRDELLRRLAHPFWFQSFGAGMGMDWHSSGITNQRRRGAEARSRSARRRTWRSCLRRARKAFEADA